MSNIVVIHRLWSRDCHVSCKKQLGFFMLIVEKYISMGIIFKFFILGGI